MNACLTGLRVLDLSRILAGPWATQLLADLGAEVIKIEKPEVGDDTRGWGPPFVGEHEADLFSAYYLAANRGKKSVAVDFSKREGREIVAALAKSCDVVIENFKVDGLKRLGLDYEALSAVNSRLIFCSITGFGQTGPYKDKPGYDLLVQAMGGLMSITGDPDGEPMKVGVAVADILTGLYATVAILAALNERRTSDTGQHIDLALLDVQVATLANQGMIFLTSGQVRSATGTRIRISCPIRHSPPATVMSSWQWGTTPSSRGSRRSWAFPSYRRIRVSRRMPTAFAIAVSSQIF